jgi:hypothetical protein
VSADETVHGGRGRGRLAQRFHLLCLLPLPVLSQFAFRLVARLRELLDRERVQAVDDLLDAHSPILPDRGLGESPARRRRP